MRNVKPIESVPAVIDLVCACGNLRRAARAVTHLYSSELVGGGLDVAPFALLWTLTRVGECTQQQLGKRLALDSSTLTRTLAPLIKKGWVGARPGADRRERRLRVTPAGRRRMQQSVPSWRRAQARLKKALGLEDWGRLSKALLRVTRAALQA